MAHWRDFRSRRIRGHLLEHLLMTCELWCDATFLHKYNTCTQLEYKTAKCTTVYWAFYLVIYMIVCGGSFVIEIQLSAEECFRAEVTEQVHV